MSSFTIINRALILFFVHCSTLTLASNNITFSHACVKGTSINVAAVGDILLHTALQKKAAQEKNFEYLWKNMSSYIQGADIAYANLEGPVAINTPVTGVDLEQPSHCWDLKCYSAEFKNAEKYTNSQGKIRRRWHNGSYYSSYPLFNYHPDLAADLKKSGFDIVSTANNHSLDRRSKGADRTIESLLHVDLNFTGTRMSMETRKERSWVTRTMRENITLSWISCTYGTNGIPDKLGQVLHCFTPKGEEIISKLIQEEVELGHTVIITPHWGNEYNSNLSDEENLSPTKKQKKFGRKWLNDGASLILGSHPHAFQKIEQYVTHDAREGLIVYSMGNFVSNQGAAAQRATGIVFIGLTKNNFGETLINGVKLLPAYMGNRYSRNENMTIVALARGSEREEFKYLSGVVGKSNFVYAGENIITNPECY